MNERTEVLMLQVHAAAEILPAEDELREGLRMGRHQEAVGPVLYPGPWQRGADRLAALLEVLEAALAFQSAWEHLREVAMEEADPDMDQAALDTLDAFHRAHRGGAE